MTQKLAHETDQIPLVTIAMNMTIRQYQPADREAVMALHHAGAGQTRAPYFEADKGFNPMNVMNFENIPHRE